MRTSKQLLTAPDLLGRYGSRHSFVERVTDISRCPTCPFIDTPGASPAIGDSNPTPLCLNYLTRNATRRLRTQPGNDGRHIFWCKVIERPILRDGHALGHSRHSSGHAGASNRAYRVRCNSVPAQLSSLIQSQRGNARLSSRIIRLPYRPVVKEDGVFLNKKIDEYANDILLPEMKKVFSKSNIRKEIIGEVTGFDRVEKSEACELVSSLTGDNSREVVSFGTEAGLFQEIGMSTVVCGPGSIEQAHKVDEFIELNELKKCLKFLDGLKKQSLLN